MGRLCEECKQTSFGFADESGIFLCLNCSGVTETLARQGIGTEDHTDQNQLQLPLESV